MIRKKESPFSYYYTIGENLFYPKTQTLSDNPAAKNKRFAIIAIDTPKTIDKLSNMNYVLLDDTSAKVILLNSKQIKK